MDCNVGLPKALRGAAQQTGYVGADALGWRELLEDAADEIDRLRIIVEHNDDVRTAANTPR